MLTESPIPPHQYALAVYQQIYSKYQEALTYPRFSRFRGENEPLDHWQAILGPDVNGLTHPLVVFNRAIEFIQIENAHSLQTTKEPRFSLLEQQDLVSAALIHEVGELKFRGIGPGDIPDPAKTAQTNSQEGIIARLVIFEALNAIHRENYQTQLELMFLGLKTDANPIELFKAAADSLRENLNPQLQRQGDTLIYLYQQIINNPDTFLGGCFRLVEKIQYVATGIKAFGGGNPKVTNGLFFAAEVLQDDLPHVIKAASAFRYPQIFLTDHAGQINQILDQTPSLAQTSGYQSFFSREKLNQALTLWQQWQQKN